METQICNWNICSDLHRASSLYQPNRSTWESRQLPRVHLCSYSHSNFGQKDSTSFVQRGWCHTSALQLREAEAILYQFNLNHKPLLTSKIRSPNEKKKVPYKRCSPQKSSSVTWSSLCPQMRKQEQRAEQVWGSGSGSGWGGTGEELLSADGLRALSCAACVLPWLK